MGIKVTAIQTGYYGLQLREPGRPSGKFEIQDMSEFSRKWMIEGHRDFAREELAQMGRDAKRQTQAQLIGATRGAPSAPVSVAVSKNIGRASDKSPI